MKLQLETRVQVWLYASGNRALVRLFHRNGTLRTSFFIDRRPV